MLAIGCGLCSKGAALDYQFTLPGSLIVQPFLPQCWKASLLRTPPRPRREYLLLSPEEARFLDPASTFYIPTVRDHVPLIKSTRRVLINEPPPLNRDYDRDPNIQALQRRGFIDHGSTLVVLDSGLS